MTEYLGSPLAPLNDTAQFEMSVKIRRTISDVLGLIYAVDAQVVEAVRSGSDRVDRVDKGYTVAGIVTILLVRNGVYI